MIGEEFAELIESLILRDTVQLLVHFSFLKIDYALIFYYMTCWRRRVILNNVFSVSLSQSTGNGIIFVHTRCTYGLWWVSHLISS